MCRGPWVFDSGPLCGMCETKVEFDNFRQSAAYREFWDLVDLEDEAGIEWCDVEEDDYSEESMP